MKTALTIINTKNKIFPAEISNLKLRELVINTHFMTQTLAVTLSYIIIRARKLHNSVENRYNTLL